MDSMLHIISHNIYRAQEENLASLDTLAKKSDGLEKFVARIKRLAWSRFSGGNGSPTSIPEFVKSVCSGRIKAWTCTEGGIPHRNKRTEKRIASRGIPTDNYLHQHYEEIIIGHFRENFKGVILSKQELQEARTFFGMCDNEETNEFVARNGVGMMVGSPEFKKHFFGDESPRYVFPITLTRSYEAYTFLFGQSYASGNSQPDIYSVLATITKYDPGTLEDFCSDFGYDPDKVSVRITYGAVVEEYRNVQRLFGDIMDELQQIN